MKEKNTTQKCSPPPIYRKWGLRALWLMRFSSAMMFPLSKSESENLSAERSFTNGSKLRRERGTIYNGIGQKILREV